MLTRQAGDVAARSRQTLDDACANRISRSREHDRDHRCRLLGRERRESVVRHDNIDLKPDELGGDLGKSLVASLGPAILDCEIAAVAPPQFPQSPNKGGSPFALCRCRTGAQQANDRWLALLRARRQRPRRRAADERDELAPFHCPRPPVLPTERIAYLRYGRRLLRCGVSNPAMTAWGPEAVIPIDP